MAVARGADSAFPRVPATAVPPGEAPATPPLPA